MNESPGGSKAAAKSNFYYCKHCNFSTVHYSRMNSHSVVHSSMRPYLCEQCSYAAKRKSDLKKHIIYRHKMQYLAKSNNSSTAAPTSMPSTTTHSINKSQQSSTSATDNSFVYTLATEQEVASSPLSNHDESNEVSIHNNPPLTTIKLEIDDDVEIVPTHHIPFEHNNTLLQTSNSLCDDVPISVSLPSTIFQMSKMDNNICMSSLGCTQIITTPTTNQQIENTNNITPNQLIFPRNIVVTTKDASVATIQSSFCTHCRLLFFDNGLYAMHMGLHHSENPWQCNICSQVHNDVYSFTLHFITHHQTDVKNH